MNCWVVTDASPSITVVPANAADSTCGITNIQLPFQYAIHHQTGPGIKIGPDGNPWFVILNGPGLVGKICRHTYEITIFELFANDWNPNPRLCHLHWDFKENMLYTISSDLLDKKAADSLIRIKFDDKYEEVIAQHELALPTQGSAIHRIAHIDHTETHDPTVVYWSVNCCHPKFYKFLPVRFPDWKTFPSKRWKLRSVAFMIKQHSHHVPLRVGPYVIVH